MKKVAVVLSGCGVYDGSEIQEAVITMLEIRKNGAEYQCFAPDKEHFHIINHLTGEEMPEKRNILIEAARIARGDIKPLSELRGKDYDAIVIPGGFGSAKNLTRWGIDGPKGDIDPDIKRVLIEAVEAGIPTGLLCMSPVIMAKALEGTGRSVRLTVGTTEEKSPYDIDAISNGIDSVGARSAMCPVRKFVIDEENKVITTPAYMMEANIEEVAEGISRAVSKLLSL
ncbi:MAG: isoprenoid biosynthesis glyoxalase ElbB [Nitrospinota bacterium]|nr:isoprenoid biosynthesis glyoxalase ElbB [Nitrospinota bacterium]